jgi:hypothetical protein
VEAALEPTTTAPLQVAQPTQAAVEAAAVGQVNPEVRVAQAALALSSFATPSASHNFFL